MLTDISEFARIAEKNSFPNGIDTAKTAAVLRGLVEDFCTGEAWLTPLAGEAELTEEQENTACDDLSMLADAIEEGVIKVLLIKLVAVLTPSLDAKQMLVLTIKMSHDATREYDVAVPFKERV